MSSFTIRFEGSISLQEPDATGARSVLIQNIRIYLPEDIERGIVPPNLTAPHVPSESSQPSYKQEAPVEIQEKQEKQIPEKPQMILTPYSVVTDDEDDDQPNFQWSWNHITPTSSSSSTEVPNAPIKPKKSSKKEIDPFDFSSTPPSSSSSSTKVPNAPLKVKRPSSSYSSNWIENTKQKILESQQTSSTSSSVSSSVKPSSPSSSSDEKYDLQKLFNDHLKQFKMTPESMCENNPQKKQKHFYHFMFWHNFQHNGHCCLDTCKCIINYIYN
ncbi:hypothetical protein EBU71_16250, partial [bacterium]|nr:hypothetical protein [Candidatus Elulimicrobium humile]